MSGKPRERISRWIDPSLGIRVPSRGTKAFRQFVISYQQINSFLSFLLRMVGAVEHAASTAHTALVGIADTNEKQDLIEAWRKRRSAVEVLKSHRQFLLEIVLVRHVENYLNYLSSLLKEIFEAKPESLRSAEKIDLETVLRHANIDDLVRTVAERKVESLTYASFDDLATYFYEKFHISLIAPDEKKMVVNAIETRNISVHNRCEINRRFLMRTDSDESTMGQLRRLDIEGVEDVARCLAGSVIRVDREARKRLHVRGHNWKVAPSN